jgi:hypothetical protein
MIVPSAGNTKLTINCTHLNHPLLLQAPDVCWNAPFKAHYRELYEDWLANGPKTYTAGGNMRPPTRIMLATWVRQAWDKVSREIIVKSFKVCTLYSL